MKIFEQVLQKGFQVGLKEVRELQDKDKAYGDDESDDEYTDIAKLFFVYFKFKRQFDNAYKILQCSPGIAKKINHAFRRQKFEEMVRKLSYCFLLNKPFYLSQVDKNFPFNRININSLHSLVLK